ncbi:hypothetical protein AVEN_171096-1, partial [Araneus ventricosus]
MMQRRPVEHSSLVIVKTARIIRPLAGEVWKFEAEILSQLPDIDIKPGFRSTRSFLKWTS